MVSYYVCVCVCVLVSPADVTSALVITAITSTHLLRLCNLYCCIDHSLFIELCVSRNKTFTIFVLKWSPEETNFKLADETLEIC